jgi:hypothetical protein
MASLLAVPPAVFPLGLLALAFDRQLVVAVDEDFQVAQLKLGKFRFNVQVAVVLPCVERWINAVGKPIGGWASRFAGLRTGLAGLLD